MKAIVIDKAYGIENISITEQPLPAVDAHEVLVRVIAVSLNQLDLMVASGALASPLPHRLGSDAAGIVQQVGDQVTGFKSGDRVCTHYIQAWQSGSLKQSDLKSRLGAELEGVFSEYISVPQQYLVKTPANLTYQQAAALPLAGVTAWEAVRNAGQLRAGQTVLLQGTGGVSVFALQFARAAGAQVIVLSGSDAKLDKAKMLGADHVINYKNTPDWAETVLALTGGEGVDLAVEMSWAQIGQTAKATRLGGRIAVVGLLGGALTELSVFDVMLKSLTIIGVQAGSKASFEDMNKAVQINNIQPVIDKEFSVSDYKDAFAYLACGQHFGKVVLNF